MALSDNNKSRSLKLNLARGTAVSFNSISSLCDREIYYFGNDNSTVGTTYTVGYVLSIPEKTKRMMTYDSAGKPASFTPTKKGIYSFKIEAPGGVKKKFTIKIKAE